MADSTLPPDGIDRNLLLGVLALQLDFVVKSDLEYALQDWQRNPSKALAQVLVDRGVLAPRRRDLIEQVTDEFLLQHDRDVDRGLAAACAARELPLNLDALHGPVLRGSLATLPSSPRTLAGSLLPALPPASAQSQHAGQPRRFRILRSHARGALGVVYLARDEELHRDVALKEIQDPYHRSPDSRARFVQEAEITGSLEHPGIVPVYSLGTHADGRPFYAMRFIKGESLYEAIHRFHQADSPERHPGERALALRGLLRRFVDVCNAIAYAHSRGVIHRDIKPANIMLGAYGETLVVDWGLAKVFDEPCTADSKEIPITLQSNSAQATMLGQVVGTPAYMPPEQASGRVDEVGPSSDIYSLGATLYHLLTGGPPFPGFDPSAVIKQVIARDFPPPRRIKSALSPALEAIVMKAMAGRPADRFPSVAALAQDIERWLADEPVEAYPEPAWMRAGRWAKRHRTLVSGLAVLLFTVVVGLGVGLFFVGRERDQAQRNLVRAEENLDLAQQAVDECFVVATEDPLLQKDRMRSVRRLLLKKSLPFYQGFRSQKPDDDSIQKELGRNLFRVGQITSEIGQPDEAIRSYKEARDLFMAQVRRYPNQEEYRINLARIYNDLGNLYAEVGDRKSALEMHRLAQQLREKIAANGKAEDRADLATTLTNLGALLFQAGKYDEASELFREAGDIQGKLVERHRDTRRYRVDLAATQHNLGLLLAERKDFKGAAAAYHRARDLREQLARGESETGRHRADLADTLVNLGDLCAETGHVDEGKKLTEEARKIFSTLTGEFSEVLEYRSGLASALFSLGKMLTDTQPEQALTLLRQADDLQHRLTKEKSELLRYKKDLAGIRLTLARLYRETDRPEEALRWSSRVFDLIADMETRDGVLPDLSSLVRKAHVDRARTLVRLKRHRDAVAEWSAALERADPDERADLRVERAMSWARAGELGRAMREVEELEADRGADGERLYNLACVLALCAGQDAQQADRLGAKAVGLLERASKAGLFDEKAKVEHLKSDDDLKAIQGRADYKALVAKLEKKAGG